MDNPIGITVGTGDTSKVVDLDKGLLPKMARPKKRYERRHNGSVEFIITNKDGFVIDSGIVPADKYDDLIVQSGLISHGYQRVNFGVNPYIVKTDMVFERDLQMKMTRRFTWLFSIVMLVIFGGAYAFLLMQSSFHGAIENIRHQIISNIVVVNRSVTAGFQTIAGRLNAHDNAIAELKARINYLEHKITHDKERVVTAPPVMTPRNVPENADRQDEPQSPTAEITSLPTTK
ncbi:MAG: hypothetical protein HQL08_12980 [Nitrospirae bacterium]|nr:hypothetical protein [Nitrospirota bacterium]